MKNFKQVIFALTLLQAQLVLAGTTGNIRGVIKNIDTDEAMGGATIVARSKALVGEEVTMSDDKGNYVISNLPPGEYVVTALFADAVSERTGIEVDIDKTLKIDMLLSMKSSKGEVYTIEEAAPNVDIASSTVQTTVSEEYIEKVPLGRDRNFDQAMSVAGTAGGDAFGTAVGGATSPENAYVIDGVNTTDPSTGLMGTRMVMEFIDEFDIKEGGYGAEFGHSTGGLVNAVTKSGSNEFHGSVFLYYRPGFAQANPILVEEVGNSIRTKRLLDYYLSTGFELGGPIVKDKLWFHIGFSPEFERTNWERTIWKIDAAENNMPSLDEFGQYNMSQLAGAEGSKVYPGMASAYQYTAKLTHLIDDNNRHSLGARGAPTFFNGAVGNTLDSGGPGRGMNAQPKTFQFNQAGGNVISAVYNYAGKYFNDKLKLDAVIGWHRQVNQFNPSLVSEDASRLSFVGPVALSDFENFAGCDKIFSDDPDNPTSYCPVRNYGARGFGGMDRVRLDRISEKIGLTHLFEFAGLHQVKLGTDFEQVLSLLGRRVTGGSSYVDNGHYFRGRQYAVEQSDGSSKVINDWFEALTGTANYALYLQDSWNPISNLTLNFGLRWEAQVFYGVKSPEDNTTLEYKFGIYDNFAPRVGGVWDFMNDGKSRFYIHWGRYFETIPTDLNERAFGGEGLKMSFYDREKCYQLDAQGNKDTNRPVSAAQVTDPSVQCEKYREPTTLGGDDAIVAPGIQGQHSDEFVLGVDIEPWSSWVFGISGTYKSLGRVIEDLSADEGETYIFANPGDFDVNMLPALEAEAAAIADPEERAKAQNRNALLKEINTFPKPVREFWSMQFKLDKKLSDNFMFLGTYVVSWAWGNYPGLFSANNGQLDPNLTSQFDLKSLLDNRLGFLPQDRRHRIKLSGFYEFKLEEYNVQVPMSFSLGLSANIMSGAPLDILGAHEVYGANEVFILPRGSGGRTPWSWSVDLNISTAYQIDKHMSAELFIGLFNVTNNQGVVALDQTYTYDTVKPVKGGKTNQLAYLRNAQNKPVRVNPNYDKAVKYQSPFSAQVGFKFKF